MTRSSHLLTLVALTLGLLGCHGHSHDSDPGAPHPHGHGRDGSHGRAPGDHADASPSEQAHDHGPGGHSHAKAKSAPARVEGLEVARGTLRTQVEEAMEAHDFKRSLRLLARLRQAEPNNLWARLMLSDALVESGRIEEAETELQVVLDRKPCAAAYLRAGYLLHLRGETAAGVEVLELALEASGTPQLRAWAQVELGNLLWSCGRVKEAGASYAAAERLDPKLARAKVGRSRVLAAEGDLKSAAALLAEVASTPEHLSELAFWEAALGKASAGREHLRQARRMAVRDAFHWGRQSAVALVDHQAGGAWGVDLARRELERRGNHQGWDALAWSLYGAGRVREAYRASQRALAFGVPESLVHYHAAVIAEANARTAEAATGYGRALALNPRFHSVFARRAKGRLAVLRSVASR